MSVLLRHRLNALRAVEASGRLGSLTRAADDLGLTVGAVSQHVRNVERRIGTPLFVRSQKGLRPTEAGAILIAGLTSGFGEIARALALVEHRARRTLVVSVAPVLASRWLVPRLKRFHALRPGLDIRIDAAVDLVNLDATDVDAGVRVGSGGWPRVRAEHLIDQTIFPACDPTIAARLREVGDLAHVPIIRDHGSTALWSTWLAAQPGGEVVLGPGPTFSDSTLCLEAALSGQGVMMAWPTLAQDMLREGRLVAPFATRVPTGLAYWLVTSSRAPSSPDVAAFGAWIRHELAVDTASA